MVHAKPVSYHHHVLIIVLYYLHIMTVHSFTAEKQTEMVTEKK